LIFEKINVNSIAAFMGNAQALKISSEKWDLLSSVDNKSTTLVQTSMRTNDTECLSIVLEMMDKKREYLHLNQASIEIMMGLPFSEERKEILSKQVIPAEYND